MNTQAPNDLTSEQYWSEWWHGDTPKRRTPSWLRNVVRNLIRRHDKRLYRNLCRQIGNPNADLLEIGCGSGAELKMVHMACPNLRLHGIDFSETGLATAERLLQEAGIKATLHFGDASTAELPQHYDIVLSGGVIEHFVDPLPMVKAHVRLCKPGGLVILVVPNIRPFFHRFFLQHFDPELLAVHNLDTLRTSRLRELMQATQLEDVQVGKAGPPRLHEGAAPGKRFRRLYMLSAKIWNLMVFLLPFPPLWHAHLWAVGRVPVAKATPSSTNPSDRQ